MITSFEVGAIFKIIDDASPALRKVLEQIREINKALAAARTEARALMKDMGVDIDPALQKTRALATEWKAVSAEAQAARRSITAAARASVQMPTLPRNLAIPNFRPGIGGGGGRGSGGGVHFGSVGAPIPGGHVRLHGGGLALAGAGLLAYGVYQAAEMDDAVFNTLFHAGLPYTDDNKRKFRDIIQKAASDTGMPIRDIQQAVNDEIRMFRGTKGNGIDVLPEMLRAAATEARAKGKGTSVDEAMESLIGLAHMTKQYSPEEIKKLAPAFGFLSSSTAATLQQIERAAGYAVPILRSGMEVDPMQVLLMGVALQRAGITNTKSGTWIRNMALNAMPGTSLMSKTAYKKHEEALRALGLADAGGNPTWFTGGKPDLIKMLAIGGENAEHIPLTKRAAYEKQLFGAQGFGAFSVLSDPVVRQQMQALRADMPQFRQRYGTFFQDYNRHSTAQLARQSFADFQNVLMDIGSFVLPPVNQALRDFDQGLKTLKGILPEYKSPNGKSIWSNVGARFIEAAVPGGVFGSFVPGIGTAAGALTAGGVSAGLTLIENMLGLNDYGSEVAKSGNAAATAAGKVEAFRKALDSLSAPRLSVAPGPSGTKGLQHHSSIYLDGRKVGDAVVRHMASLGDLPIADSPYPDGTIRPPAIDFSLG